MTLYNKENKEVEKDNKNKQENKEEIV